MRRQTVPAVAAACALAAAALAGCGSSSVSNAVDPVAKAATVSNQAAGMRMNLLMHLSSPALPEPITGTGSGTYELTNHTGSASMTLNFGSIPQVTQALGASTLRIDEVIDGSTIYMKLPSALSGRLPGHKPWLKINLASAGAAAGIPGLSSLMNNPASSDPTQLLRYLQAASGNVTKVGSESVDGFQTTHYRAQIKLDRVPNAFPQASRPQVRQTISALERVAHVSVLPVDVWIDGRHLVRRERISFKETVSGQSLGVTITVDIPEYGPQPPPTLPPASQVTDLTRLAAGG